MRTRAVVTRPDGVPHYFVDTLNPSAVAETYAQLSRMKNGAELVDVEIRIVRDTHPDLMGGTIGAPESAHDLPTQPTSEIPPCDAEEETR